MKIKSVKVLKVVICYNFFYYICYIKQQLILIIMEKGVYRFWSHDWSKSIIVRWCKGGNLDLAKDKLTELLGKDFGYELAIQYKKIEYNLKSNGLTQH